MKKYIFKTELKNSSPFEIEKWAIKSIGGKATPNNTEGIDCIKNGKNIEIKCFNVNRPSLGRVDISKSLSDNLDNLLISDEYIIINVKKFEMIIYNKQEIKEWLYNRVILDKDRRGNFKFRISYNIRSKKQDLKCLQLAR